ncbi:hypothetical protein F5890DRAFT_1560451 [Lentinula detonsa]|uniref:Uncharacterized protein n=1 Tax=Lentinula detonsa TaxID=2804962 RepID=A0AA38PML3_9AGAR|nr:hypothetical protein F5890DRAFT_1560451 [Lentinula detonsa]
MERIEAEEKAAREAEEKRQAEERRIEEEKRREEERKAEEERVIREKKKEQEIAEKKRLEERRIAEEKRRVEEAAAAAEDERVHNAAYAKLVEENRIEWEKAAKELEKRQKRPVAKAQPVTVVIPPRPSGSKKKSFKSKSIISDDSDVEQREAMPAPRGEKRKRPIKMIARGGPHSDPDEDFEPENPTNSPLPSTDPSQNRPACARCVSIGRPSECRPQSPRRQAQACVVCHQQRQRCSWSGDNASRRSRGKRVKLDDDEVYEGPAARAGERRFEGPGIAEQLAAIVGQNKDLIDIARRSLDVQERIMYLLVRREKRELKVLGGNEERSEDEDEDEDEDGEGEEDEEEKEKNNKEKKREEIREGKKRAN